MATRLVRGLRVAAGTFLSHQQSKPANNCNPVFKHSVRNYYMSQLRKTTCEENIVSLIRNEIQYEIDTARTLHHIPEFKFKEFEVDERPGEKWIRLTRKFGENEEINVEATMFDGSIPIGKDDSPNEVHNPITVIVAIFKGKDNNVLEFLCDAWPQSIDIRKVYTRGNDQIRSMPYMGPGFKELDDNLQYSLYDFLKDRGIDDKLCMSLHLHMWNKEKNEYLRYLEKVESFVQKK